MTQLTSVPVPATLQLTPASDQPPAGFMCLFDAAIPPLPVGTYRWTATSELTKSVGATAFDETLDRQRHFSVNGPRFNLDPQLVAGVFPPRGAHGAYDQSLPQIVLSRRTLPWERSLTQQAGKPATPKPIEGTQPLTGARPWLALLILQEDEFTLVNQVPLEQVVDPAVFNALGQPTGIRCDGVLIDPIVLAGILPSLDELQLLAHVRQVNVLDRELNVSRGDGWFSVVIANRLPTPGKKHRAFLVSLEEQVDHIPVDPPAAVSVDLDADLLAVQLQTVVLGRDNFGGMDVNAIHGGVFPDITLGVLVLPPVGLVVLHSWEFTCEGDGSFESLMQRLDVGMLGATPAGRPAVSDTGHIRTTLHDRAGEDQAVWYRGPLVPYSLTRDAQGPYHSADQARRVTPDTGVEDITYAAAFELGRLLAAGDGRLAQELMRWRRTAYATSARNDVVTELTARLPGLEPALAAHLVDALAPALANAVAARIAPHTGPIADVYGLDPIARAPGFDAASLQAAWGLPGPVDAQVLLRGEGLVAAPPPTEAGPASIDQAVADTAGLARLAAARAQILGNAQLLIREGP